MRLFSKLQAVSIHLLLLGQAVFCKLAQRPVEFASSVATQAASPAAEASSSSGAAPLLQMPPPPEEMPPGVRQPAMRAPPDELVLPYWEVVLPNRHFFGAAKRMSKSVSFNPDIGSLDARRYTSARHAKSLAVSSNIAKQATISFAWAWWEWHSQLPSCAICESLPSAKRACH